MELALAAEKNAVGAASRNESAHEDGTLCHPISRLENERSDSPGSPVVSICREKDANSVTWALARTLERGRDTERNKTMSIHTVREFSGRHLPSAAGLAALVAALDAKASAAPLDPSLAARIGELLNALGGGDVCDDLSAEEARALVAEIRHQLGLDALLLNADTRATSWSYSDPRLLQDTGNFSRSHATVLTRQIIPALAGVAERLMRPGARHLDIGVGVAGTAIALAQQWPTLNIVGIDVWRPSLALARQNVTNAGLDERIELREQGAERLQDDSAFDLAWLPAPFMPESVVPETAARCWRALRPGAWLIFGFIHLEDLAPIPTAVWRLRLAMFGGPQWSAVEVEGLLRERGFEDVHTLPRHPGVPAAFAVGRRPS
jgi:precorrin-6B methylase 2